ncbi:Uncharacterised protein [Mycobacteroides abscessus subsp. abscessus]|nr:Uncharacterised protein [Mycobacteroides abscessus subsp. abscessus]
MPIASVDALDDAICSARSRTAPSRASGSTTSLTSPQSAAVAASIGSPVSSIFIARLRPIALVRATIGVEQNNPIRTPGVLNEAVVDATARSQVATNWQPAAKAGPATCAITGWRIS